MSRLTVVHPDADVLAEATAARLICAVQDAQAQRGVAHVVLTGGGVGIASLAALRTNPARDAVNWAAVEFWWGDERFLPLGHPDRNATQAWEALLSHLPVEPARVHEMAASDGEFGDDVDAAAAAYADDLRAAAGADAEYAAPAFDVLMLGMGPDGHVASLFPHHPGLQVDDRTALAVRESPKPPPVRISMSLETINRAQQVWVVAAGKAKATVVSQALAGAPAIEVPAAAVRGRQRTLWLVDADATTG